MPNRPLGSAAALIFLAGTAQALAASPFPAVFDLSSLDGADGFVLNGISSGDFSGYSVSSAGDVNGDGIDDLIIGAFAADPGGRESASQSYVVFGATGLGAAGSIELSALNGANGFVLNGISSGDLSGFSVSSAGDVNGDGMDDLIIGAPDADPGGQDRAGESYLVFGKDTAAVGSFQASIELSALNGADGFVLKGVDALDRCGASVSSAGDVNGDGLDDLIIGARDAAPGGRIRAGESYVVFGATGLGAGGAIELSSLDGTNGFVLNGIDASDRSGGSVSSAGDVNGDGVDDLIIGASWAVPAGESYVVFGSAGLGADGSIELSALNGADGFVLNGISSGDFSGYSVSSAGDVNGDGIDDLIIGAFAADPGGRDRAGESYVVFGAVGLGAGGAIELAALNGADGFVLDGIDAGDWSGRSVSSAGDVNGDGLDDLIIGAYRAEPGGRRLAGASYVVFGATGLGAGGAIELSALNGANGFVLDGIDANDNNGRSVSSAGDVNGDGMDDLIIGADSAAPSGRSAAGESYVVFGRRCAGDVNGDGTTDVFDFADFAANFGAGPGATREMGDLTDDGFVDLSDFAELAPDFGCMP